jgi:hypothetical protein
MRSVSTSVAKTAWAALLSHALVGRRGELLPVAQAQEVGVSICACQPDVYEFTVDLSLQCDDMDIKKGDPGILDTACVVNTSGDENVTDFTPTIVTEIQVLELDQNFDVVGQYREAGEFTSGDTFQYTSVTATPSKLNATSIPSAIQLFLSGRNAAEQDLVNFYAIVYDNDCGVWPLLEEGDRAGWTVFVSTPAYVPGTPSENNLHSHCCFY